MRTIKTGLLAIAICLLASGCSTLFTASKKDTVSHIRPGMSKEQVEGMLGSPDYTRFDGGIEQWEYGSFYYVDSHSVNVIIDFDNGRVIALNTFNTPPVAPVPPRSSCCCSTFECTYRTALHVIRRKAIREILSLHERRTVHQRTFEYVRKRSQTYRFHMRTMHTPDEPKYF